MMNALTEITASPAHLWFGNTLVSIVVPSGQGADGMCVIEHWMPFGDSPPLHVHRNEDEIFHIQSGAMRFVVAGKEIMAYAGETLLAPKGVPHTYRVESAEGAHCLTVTPGGGFETTVRSAGRRAERMELPEMTEPTPEMIAALTSLCATNGIDIIGPPLV